MSRAHLLKHEMIFLNEIIEYDKLSEEPGRFKKILQFKIIDKIRYPLI